MTGKYDALIAEAHVRIIRSETHTHAVMADTELIGRLAAALRAAQAHVPPEGWRVTEWTQYNESEGRVAWAAESQMSKHKHWNVWRQPKRGGGWICDRRNFPTAAAAMAAIEEMK